MPDRSEKALRLLCWALGAVLLLQVVIKLVARDPLAGLKIPALPALSEAADSASGGKGTNAGPVHAAEAQSGRKGTNALAVKETGRTNLVSRPSGSNATSAVVGQVTEKSSTNLVAEPEAGKGETNAPESQFAAKPGTNALPEAKPAQSGSNALAAHDLSKAGTNAVSEHKPGGKSTNEMAMNGANPRTRPGMAGKAAPALPLPIQARVDRVVDSELFGPVFHPMPMGLLGIAGNMAFLRAPSGQTSAVKEGDELGGIKLLRIGINRVLVEEDGQKKELMIFEGLGGQSLLPK
jgi:hypothetical protein